MKTFRKILIALLALVVIAVLFRGFLYRQLVSYEVTGNRTNYIANNPELVSLIDSHGEEHLQIDDIISESLEITSRHLHYTMAKNDNDPNKLIESKSAHCVGYASFCASACNHLLEKNGLEKTYEAIPKKGNLYFLGMNVHRWFSSPFFKDHDFVVIENKITGEKSAVDPTIHDYLWIDFVSLRKQ